MRIALCASIIRHYATGAYGHLAFIVRTNLIMIMNDTGFVM